VERAAFQAARELLGEGRISADSGAPNDRGATRGGRCRGRCALRPYGVDGVVGIASTAKPREIYISCLFTAP